MILYKFLLGLTLVGFAYGGDNMSNQDVTIEQVTPQFGLAEGPHWDHRTQKLYFVDIYNQKICRLDPGTGAITCATLENGPVGVAVPVQDETDKFIAGSGTDFVMVTWNPNSNLTKASAEVLATVDKDRVGTRWNDGKVDSAGRFWGGTMGPENNGILTYDQGSLYRITSDFVPNKMISPVSISNGIAWSLEDDKFYYIDSPTRRVVSYDYDPHAGTISNGNVVFDLKEHNITGVPDGMTIDLNGNLWIAVYMGKCVLNVNPKTGELLRTIELPAERVTSVAFGGPLLDVLYVTTSSFGLTDAEFKAQPKAGSLFAVKGLGVRGLLANSFKLNK